MSNQLRIQHFLAALGCALVGACSTPDPVRYSGVTSSPYLQPNATDDSAHVPYRYSTPVDWHRYDRAIVDPVTVYKGADNQLGDLPDEDKLALAQYMQTKFVQALSQHFRIVDAPADKTLRVKVTLTGAATSKPVLSTFTRLDLAGGLYNGVQAVRGHEGMMTGSVSYVVEIYDGLSDRLLDAYVSKQYPGAYNIPATFGSLSAAETGVDKGADALAEQFR